VRIANASEPISPGRQTPALLRTGEQKKLRSPASGVVLPVIGKFRYGSTIRLE
jgi:hypothetical protein